MATDNTREIWSRLRRALGSANQEFVEQTKHFSQLQSETLIDICQRAADSGPGRAHGFSHISSKTQFQAQCPVSTYEALASDILADAHFGRSSLFSEELICFEQTGGSSSGGRLIPYNRSLLNDFRRAVFAWLADVIDAYQLTAGTIFWPISPPAPARSVNINGVPLGLSSDGAYFGKEVAGIFAGILAVAPDIPAGTMAEWQLHTAKGLLKAEDLVLVSVWSPTYFTELLKFVKAERSALIAFVAAEVSASRLSQLEEALAPDEPDWQMIWPALKLISCWTDGAAQSFAASLAGCFPGVPIQGKGLLATEAVMSIPLAGVNDPVLVPTSCYYEFRAEDGSVIASDQVVTGVSYDLIITTRGGLYRYDIGDRVLVTGFFHQAPTIRFVGRANTSDLCGEKLSDHFVSQCLSTLPGYAVLIANSVFAKPGYELIADSSWQSVLPADEVAEQIEVALARNPQYRIARSLLQLAQVTVRFVDDPLGIYVDSQLAAGRRLGDIKPPVLLPDSKVFHEQI